MNFQFESLHDFIQMGGHGPYVWFSYAIVFATLLYFGFLPNWQYRQFVKRQRWMKQHRQQQHSIQATARAGRPGSEPAPDPSPEQR